MKNQVYNVISELNFYLWFSFSPSLFSKPKERWQKNKDEGWGRWFTGRVKENDHPDFSSNFKKKKKKPEVLLNPRHLSSLSSGLLDSLSTCVSWSLEPATAGTGPPLRVLEALKWSAEAAGAVIVPEPQGQWLFWALQEVLAPRGPSSYCC